MNTNQENQISWGGKRKGAGRPKGTGHKPKLTEDLTEEQKRKLLEKTLEKALKGDSKLLQFLLEQIYGKATQSLDMENGIQVVINGIEMVKPYDSNPENTDRTDKEAI